MRRRLLLQVAPAVLLAATRASFAQAGAAEKLRVVATFTIVADMARIIGADDITVTSLVGPNGDPHDYEPRPSDLLALQAADVLIENGLGLEGWMARMLPAAGFHGQRVTAGAAVTPRHMTEDSKQITDPHAWQNPRNGILYAQAIADGLSRAAPARAQAFHARAAAYIQQISATDAWIAQTLAPIPPAKRKIITSHDAFGYYAAQYGITMRGVEGIDTNAEPSAKYIAGLAALAKQQHIRAVFIENMTDPRLATVLAQESGAILGGTVYSDALSPPDGPAATYLAMFHHNTTLFANAMAGN